MNRIMRKLISIFLLIAVVITSITVSPVYVQAADQVFVGEGTASNPFLVSSADQAVQMATLVNVGDPLYKAASYQLTNDIDLSVIENWIPIGTNQTFAFSGTFDGNGFQISGIKITATVSSEEIGYFGLFGINFGTIRNLKSNNNLFSIAGTGWAFVGNVAGYNDGTIENCSNFGNTAGTVFTGGIAGSSSGGIINCYNTGNITGEKNVGGLVGSSDGLINGCYNIGSITGTSYIGGITGSKPTGTIKNCYNIAGITGTEYVGGITGRNGSDGSVGKLENCYNAGTTAGQNFFGGIAGYGDLDNTINNCYYLDIASIGVGGGNIGTTLSCTPEQMTQQNTYAGFDFETIWSMPTNELNSNYPVIRGVGDGKLQYTVSFESNGGSEVTAVGTDLNTMITKPTDPTRADYTFAGWYKDIELTQTWDFSADVVTADITLYAKWTSNQYTVSFESNGGSVVSATGTGYNTVIAKPDDPTLTDYTFAGWYKDTDLTQTWNFEVDVVTADITLYAKWTINQYTVSFESNGGSEVTAAGTDFNTMITKPADPMKTGYTFVGWYEDVDLTQTWDFVVDRVISDITLYAKWTINQYTVSFNSNGGNTVTAVGIDYNTLITKPADPVRTEYTFIGWYKGTDLTQTWDFEVDKVTADITLYAKWVNQYFVGSGIETDPYLIGTADQMVQLAALVNAGNLLYRSAYYQMTTDIDLSVIENWVPIGNTNSTPFCGSFDGNGNRIIGLKINATVSSETKVYFGLFGYSSGSICQIGMIDNSITVTGSGLLYVGSIAGYNYHGTISGCYNTGTVSSKYGYIGVIAGYNYHGTIIGCYNTGMISGSQYTGGIAGFNNYGTISNCYNTGSVSGKEAGGVTGKNYGTIRGCYNTGTVSGSTEAGGIAGEMWYGTIIGCYNTGMISSYYSTGGIVGYNEGTISECYNTGTVFSSPYTDSIQVLDRYGSTSDIQYTGGIVGEIHYYEISDCYNTGVVSGSISGGIVGYNYNSTISNTFYLDINTKGTGSGIDTSMRCTLDQMQIVETYNGFDFLDTWIIQTDNCYPFPQLRTMAMNISEANYQEYAGGRGTITEPYLISDKKQLDNVRLNLDAYYELTADITFDSADFSIGGSYYHDGEGWYPIGDEAQPFSGHFDGKGHQITGLQIQVEVEAGSTGYYGLFGCSLGIIKHIGLVDNIFTITGSSISIYVGGIAGYNFCGTINECYNTGTISSYYSNGGIVGYNFYGTINDCYNMGTVSSQDWGGGIAGCNRYGTINDCYNAGTISGSSSGGITGINSGTINDCYNTGIVLGSTSGGIAGANSSGTTSNTFYLDINTKGTGSGIDTSMRCTLDQMQIVETYNGFDFLDTWIIQTDNCYPFPQLRTMAMNISEANYQEYAGGRGTITEPYLISDKKQLDNVRLNLDAYYELTADITFDSADFSIDGSYYHDGEGWYPIGDEAQPFSGHFDGKGHQITGLQIQVEVEAGSTGYYGLFGYNIGIIKHIGLVDNAFKITGSSSSIYVGGIAGYSYSGTISDCNNTGTVSGSQWVGGIVGKNYSGTISDCYNTGKITVSGTQYDYSGGIVSFNGGTISGCYNTGEVSGGYYTGGISGHNECTINNCYNTGTVSGSQYVGGVSGYSYSYTISGCYNTGEVSGSRYVGGISGYSDYGTIDNCYNAGNVSSSYFCGGIAGINYSVLNSCYNIGTILGISYRTGGITGYNSSDLVTNVYFLDETPKGIGYGNGTAISCTWEQMLDVNIFTGFDFGAIWRMPSDFSYTPVLKELYVPLAGIVINDLNIVTGQITTIPLNTIPGNATIRDFIWTSSDATIATVDQSGQVSGCAIGQTTIFVASKVNDNFVDACVVTVQQGVNEIILNPTKPSVITDSTIQMEATVLPADAVNKTLQWSSSNTEIATVDQNGLVFGINPGSVVITATAQDGTVKKASATLTVIRPVSGIEIDLTTLSINKGQQITLSTIVEPFDASNKSVIWSSNNTSIAVVSTTGVVTGISRGFATISAKTSDGGFQVSCTLEVKQLVTGITIDRNNIGIAVNEKIHLIAQVSPYNANNQAVTWQSNNPTIATVDVDGWVSGIADGSAIITTKSVDGSYSAYCAVTVGQGVTSIVVTGPEQVGCNESDQMYADLEPETAINKTILWSVIPKSGLAVITSSGLLLGTSVGTVTVVATASDGTGIIGCQDVNIVKYLFNFESNGGSNVSEIETDYNTTITKPSDPTRIGYTFVGWYKDTGLTQIWDFDSDVVTEDTSIYAKWTINQYTASFASNGGSTVSAIVTDYNTTITKPSDPTRLGYTFAGWFKDAGMTQIWDFELDVVTEDTFIYAKWTINQYTASFASNGGNAVPSIETDYNTTITKPSDPTKLGYTFAGWFKDAGLTQIWDFDSDVVTEDTTLYAKWTINQYTASFASNGGNAVTAFETDYNTAITKPSDPTKPGYTFAGWYKDAGLTQIWDFDSDVVTEDTTLYAKWTINQYTASFASNGGSTVTVVDTDYNTTITKPSDPTRIGYTFAGWYKDAGLTQIWDFESEVVTEDITLYAQWTINQYTASFASNGGSTVTAIETDYNTTITKPSDPTRNGYTFVGWYKEAGLIQTWDFESDVVTEDTTLYAQWTINRYTASFASNGGNAVTAIETDYNTAITKPSDPTRIGYTFAGWYKDAGLTQIWNFESDVVTEDTSIYAQWTINQYTASFASNGGSTVPAVDTDYNTTITKPSDPTMTGYTFAGWYKDEALLQLWDFAEDRVTEDFTLYADWTINQYTSSFESNGGSTVTAIDTDYNTKITKPTDPTRSGYTFANWYKDADLTQTWNFEEDMVTEDFMLYAKWAINQYTISFDSNDGSIVATIETDYNTIITKPSDPTRTGYTFGGWYKEEACTSPWNFSTDKVIMNTTVYAKWTINQYTTSFEANGGSAVPSIETDYNTTITAPSDPTRTGHTFAGWYKDVDLSQICDFTSDAVTTDTTLYARWMRIPVSDLTIVSTGYDSLSLSWAEVPGSSGYQVYRSTLETGIFTLISIVASGSTTGYEDTGIACGTTCYYKVQAYWTIDSSEILSDYSPVASAMPIPAVPTNLKAVSAGYNSTKLAWTAVAGATGYSIYRSTSPTSGFTYIKTVTTASYINTGLTTGTTYFYQIKAYTMVGTTKINSALSYIIMATPIPASPKGLKAVSAGYESNILTWTPVAGATGYSLYRSTSPTSGFAYFKTVTTASYTNTALITGTTYYYQIKAYTMVGTTKIYSAFTSVVSSKPIPATPTGLTAASAGSNSIITTWNPVAGATGYAVYRSTSPTSGFTYVKTVTSGSYTNTGLTTGTTYYYQIKAYTLMGTTKIYSAATTTAGATP